MYALVLYKNGIEKHVGDAKPYSEAYADYEAIAKTVNATDDKGKYLQPDMRVAIRNLN